VEKVNKISLSKSSVPGWQELPRHDHGDPDNDLGIIKIFKHLYPHYPAGWTSPVLCHLIAKKEAPHIKPGPESFVSMADLMEHGAFGKSNCTITVFQGELGLTSQKAQSILPLVTDALALHNW
jgi:hypothetical protein